MLNLDEQCAACSSINKTENFLKHTGHSTIVIFWKHWSKVLFVLLLVVQEFFPSYPLVADEITLYFSVLLFDFNRPSLLYAATEGK